MTFPKPRRPKPSGARRIPPTKAGERRIPSRYLCSYKIQEVIRRRQILLVQVVKEERGTKGAASNHLHLPGWPLLRADAQLATRWRNFAQDYLARRPAAPERGDD